MNEGNTAKVSAVSPPLRAAFNVQANCNIIKEFKAFSDDGASTLPDFENEVAVLNILEKYQDRLPFKIPRIGDYGRYKDAAKGGPVAFIKMTRLANSLSDTDMASLTPEMKQQHAAEAGKALAKLHALKLTPEEQSAISCSPIQFNLNWLARRGKTPQQEQTISQLSAALEGMTGDPVFLHNDFHHKNLFAKSYIAPISGVCDFCCAGMGPKEMDFFPFLGDKETEKSFLDAYAKAGGAPVNDKNLSTVRNLFYFIRDYHRETPAVPAPTAMGLI